MNQSKNISKFILAFDSGAKGIRYIDEYNSTNGTSDKYCAKEFYNIEEAIIFNDKYGYACWIEELT